MKLINAHVENFGILHDLDMDFTDGINIISQENGWGKSTLMAFIKSMFYGLSGTTRHSLQNERLKFAPWQGGAFGGFLTFEAGGKIYTVNRIFNAERNGHDSFELIDGDSGLAADDYSERLGEELFGIDSDSFMRSAYIGQNDVSGGVTDDINAKISNLTDNTNDINNYENAAEYIKKTLNSMSPTRVKGSIYAQNARINELEASVRLYDTIEGALLQTRELAERVKADIQGLSDENKLINKKIREISSYSDVRSNKESHRLLNENYISCRDTLDDAAKAFPGRVPGQNELQKAIETAAEYDKQHAICASKKAPAGPLAGIILTVLGVLAIIADIIIKPLAFMVLGAVLIAAGIILIIISSRKKKAYESELEAVSALRKDTEGFILGLGINPSSDLTGQLRVISDRLTDYHAAARAAEQARRQLEDFERANGTEYLNVQIPESSSGDIFPLSARLHDNVEKMREWDRQLRSYEEQLDGYQERLDEISAQRAELSELREKTAADMARYSHIEKAGEYLAKAKNNITAKYIGPIKSSFDRYYRIAAGTSAESFHIDAQTHVTFDEQGGRRETETLSRGRKDLVSFCLRLALIDAMYDDSRPPIILDDPFVNLSSSNEAGCRKVLDMLAERDQILLFTCKE